MTISHWNRQHAFKSSDLSTDVLIIGAGYAGLSTAYWLTELRSDLKVTIIDQSSAGSGASGRNAGFLTKGSASFYKSLSKQWGHGKALELNRFADESIQMAYQKILRSSPELKFERTSAFTLFRSEELHRDWLFEGFDPAVFGFSWLANDKLSPKLQPHFWGAYETTPEYKVNPTQLIASLKTTLESRKVQILENLPAFQLHASGASTTNNEIRAKKVILALNGYFPQFHSAFHSYITPRRAQMIAVEIEEELDCPGLYYEPDERVYWRKAQDNILLVGGKRLVDEKGETGDFDKVTPVIQEALEDYLKTLGLKYKVLNRWSGTMAFTEHELPYVTRIESPLETYMVGGFSGHGMGLGFLSGREAAELCLEIKSESFFDKFKKVDITL